MNSEIAELLETAMLKEVASEAFYRQAIKHTDDPGTISLLSELANTEKSHLEGLKRLNPGDLLKSAIERPKIEVGFTDPSTLQNPTELEGASLTDTLLFAIEKEAESVKFYSDLMGVFSGEQAKDLCYSFTIQELSHKRRLEDLYESLLFSDY